VKRCWEIIADNLSKAGWSWGCVATVDREGQTIFVADALLAPWGEICSCAVLLIFFAAKISFDQRDYRLPPRFRRVITPPVRWTKVTAASIRHLGIGISRNGNKHALPLFEIARVLVGA